MSQTQTGVTAAFKQYFVTVLRKEGLIDANCDQQEDSVLVTLSAKVDGEDYIVRQRFNFSLTCSEVIEAGNAMVRHLWSTYTNTAAMKKLLAR